MDKNVTLKDLRQLTSSEFFAFVVATIKDARYFVIAATLLFFAGIAVGFVFPEYFEPVFEILAEKVADRFVGRSLVALTLLILVNNIFAAAIAVAFGSLLGFVPAAAAVVNGIVIGFISEKLYSTGDIFSLSLILPHGVFELPALFLAWGLGLWIGAWPLRRDRDETLTARYLKAASVFALIVPLLIIAAIIEGVLGYFLGVTA